MAVFAGGFALRPDAARAPAGAWLRHLRRPPGSVATEWEASSGCASLAGATILREVTVDADLEVAVAADARLDDPATLQRQLEAPSSASGAALIRLAYRRWGRGCLEHLDGDFAFVVWDARSRSVFGARDRFGVRPFVYAHAGAQLWVGTQPSLLLAAGVDRQPDPWHLAELIAGSFTDPASTAFACIQRLPAGHWLLWDRNTLRVECYWRPDPGQPELRQSLEQTAEAFHCAFDASVTRRIDVGGTLGALLSGGLDSSSVVVTAQALSPGPLPVFTAVYPELERADERAYAELVAHHIGAEPTYVHPLGRSPLAEEEAESLGIASPLYMPTWPMEAGLLEAAQEAGVRVLLSGHGGDHVLHASPLGVFGDWILGGRWQRLGREARSRSSSWPGAMLAIWEMGVKDLLRQRQPRWLREARQRSVPALLHPQLAEETRFRDRLASRGPLLTARHRLAAFVHHAPTHAGLERMAWVCEALGVSFQTPYWDRALVNLCLRVPRDHLLRDGTERALIREALAHRLPEAIRTRRSKATFDPLLNVGLHRHCQDDLRRMLAEPGDLAEWCNMPEVHRIAEGFFQASPTSLRLASSGEAQALLRVLTLWRWLRRTGQ